MFARIFISFIAILTTSTVITSVVVSCSGSETLVPRFLPLIAILGGASGLFYFILTRALRHTEQKQKTNKNPTESPEQPGLSPLSASMSHELRTPLNAIIGFTGIILQGMSGEINRRQRDQLERVLDSAKKLLSMITDIISIAKIDSGSIRMFPATFSVDEAINEAIRELLKDNQPDFNEIYFEVNAPHKIEIYTDQKKLVQCITNILICIVECADIKNISITAEETDNHLNIIIGTSLSEPNQEQLNRLVSFLETGEPVPENSAGHNIRLHLTKKIISRLLGGSMSVNTESGNNELLRLTFSSLIESR